MKLSNEVRSGSILVVDDDAVLLATLSEFLQREGYEVETASSGPEALTIQEQKPGIALALVDLVMPIADGLIVTEQLRRRDPNIAVMIMTGYGTIETAVEAIKRGAEDYITKPFDYEAVRKKIARVMEILELREHVAQLQANLQRHPCFENIIYVSPAMQRVVERARNIAATDASVLIVGETGTGKEMFARAIHEISPRARNPFVPINSGALPRELVESELFGIRRGAFTGAYADTPGLFLAAAGGTVFLDEIGEMPKEVQVKLLRVLQEGELRPVGSHKPVLVDVRVVCATNRTLNELRSTFLREDLYYRVARTVIELPPLRTRPEDVMVLAQHFAGRLARRYDREIHFSRPALELLVRYPFPGNVRELENIVESATAVSVDNPQTITDADLKPMLEDCRNRDLRSVMPEQPISIEQMERFAIERALRLCKGNRAKTASMLGISRDTLYRKLHQYGAKMGSA